MNIQAQRDISRKLKIFAHAADSGNVAFTCRHFGISRETYYQWKRAYAAHGEKGLINSKPCPENPKLRTPLPIEEKILYLRRNYHFGQVRISWYRKLPQLRDKQEVELSGSDVTPNSDGIQN